MDTASDVVRRLRHLRPTYELREKWSYNNQVITLELFYSLLYLRPASQMYMTAAHMLDTYTGSYPKYAAERIFSALGMNSTTFSPNEAAATGRLTQSWAAHGHRIPYWLPEEVISLNAGPGGIITNVVDLVSCRCFLTAVG